MKRYGIILLLMGLFLTLSASALAADVKFSGEFIVGGMYLDKTTLKEDTASDGPSTAFYFQRLRVKTDVVVAPGLSLIIRFDAMERAWGAPRSTPGTKLDSQSAGTPAENENIAFDLAYVDYSSPIGRWRVGYMDDGAWGTVFMDTSVPRGKVAWTYYTGNWMFTVQIAKMAENSFTAKNSGVTASDLDGNKYCAAFRYSWKGGEAGILFGLGRDAINRPAPNNYKSLYNNFMPYAKAQIGPLKAQTELVYFIGKLKKYETGTENDVKMETLTAWLDLVADFSKFYVGGTFAYVSGDNPGTTDKIEGDALRNNGGRDWSPTLILWNNDFSYWVGTLYGQGGTVGPPDTRPQNASPMYNAFFYQLKGGVRPIDKLDIMASVSYANADKKPTGYLERDYGIEVDLTATYKITDNLYYMVGAGYLFTGDYFKGTQMNVDVSDNYLLINKLTLTF